MRAVIVGFGKVGREVVRQSRAMGARIEFVGALSSGGGVAAVSPRDRELLERLAMAGEGLGKHPSFTPGMGVGELVDEVSPDIAFVAIPPNYSGGGPNMGIYSALARSGTHTVTADKTALALDFWGTLKLFGKGGARLGYRATVAAGVPVTDVAWALRWRGVESFTAILNATTNYIISLVLEGLTYDEAVERAVREGYAEPDPSTDTHGWDSAAKAAIIASILEGRSVSVAEVSREPLGEWVEELAHSAGAEGQVIRYVATYSRDEGVSVRPVRLPAGSPLAGVRGTDNAVVFRLEGGEVLVAGPAGPAWRTARVMIGDALDILGGGDAARG